MKKATVLQQHVNTLAKLSSSPGKAAPDLGRVATALLQLQRGLTDERVLAGGHYMEEKSLLQAYLLYYWPVSYQQLMHMLRKLPATAFNFPKEAGISILDIGSGPGPASAAICDYLTKEQGIQASSLSVRLLDHSPKALSLAKHFFSRDFPAVSTESFACNLEEEFPPSGGLPAKQGYNIAVMGHSLNEMWKDDSAKRKKRTAFLGRLLDELMAEDSLLILCEPAQTKSSRELIAVRDSLLAARNDLDLLSPCPGAGFPCPALLQGEGTTCHDEGDWEPVAPATRLAQMAGLNRTSIKLSYFAFKKHGTGGPAAPERQNAEDGTFTARVVSDAMLNKAGRTRFVLCDGKRRFSISAKKGEKAADDCGFWKLKRGQLIMVRGAQARSAEGGPSYAVAEGTGIQLLG
ncbi:MAG: hypothetical protein ILP18_07540 [Treponema sp.]|nr:hypothetical protein [Treponema sp.]